MFQVPFAAFSKFVVKFQQFEFYRYFKKLTFKKSTMPDVIHVFLRKQKYTVMTHTQVNFSTSPWPELGVLLLELVVGLVSRVSLVSHMVRARAMLCMLV